LHRKANTLSGLSTMFTILISTIIAWRIGMDQLPKPLEQRTPQQALGNVEQPSSPRERCPRTLLLRLFYISVYAAGGFYLPHSPKGPDHDHHPHGQVLSSKHHSVPFHLPATISTSYRSRPSCHPTSLSRRSLSCKLQLPTKYSLATPTVRGPTSLQALKKVQGLLLKFLSFHHRVYCVEIQTHHH
jgi:hypothetical protein